MRKGDNMKISELYKLGKTQYELDFVDVDIEKDIPLFLDPYFISKCDFPFSFDAHRTLKSFFEVLIRMLQEGKEKEAKEIFSHLNEPNEFCLGLSVGAPEGRGVGPKDSLKIFDSLIKSRAIKSGLMEDIEDFRIFIKGIDKDKMSDMTANIIKSHLIKYTQDQCVHLGIPLTQGVPSGFYWDINTLSWENNYTNMLVINSRKIILVPKRIVSFSKTYTPENYVQHFILNFLQNEHLRLQSGLVKKRKDKYETPYVTKKSIREDITKTTQIDKHWITEFTEKHPDVFIDFKNDTSRKTKIVQNSELTDIPLSQVCQYLIDRLGGIDPGSENATKYHRTIIGILELLFYPNICNPTVEEKIHNGRKRIDAIFDNCAEEGFFFRLPNTHRIPSRFIIVECKNYSKDLANPELDQISGRFSPNRGQFGLIICRDIEDMDLFLARCSDTYRDSRGLILPLTDNDLVCMLRGIINQNFEVGEDILQRRFHAIGVQ